ncbi:tRNA pseudouridine(38-40) synthase TruA [Laribacter hongkongensis]|nr:tRNA pseudouridine(38-40) synthase TruA [Laribacter hongkongensis]MCG8994592.1 tRNA pseudouridine(38-40) synthase TruA [Laribacter hongkongensis]MCG9009245.1 tRNA pseudouridine(38-40) synthase TruA [Laribacter hongkongensis]MCG9021859.1 tRNA pseudouridine(38-40) synthase TruA [Laribacter hongkongensis]MCG9045589.1 tRNA pseudouridine(38-40) synthase TruA [Laribacter hongkongensis]MCG9073006.1 tRNA pseudouridine(38-40) synthase TruA [Laribacter hongkongensis]
MRIALGLEYDGRGFAGWQRQPDQDTVQGALEGALSQIAGHPVSVLAAGRTDAGVHASQQVVHFDTGVERPLTAWVRGVNRFLPPGVAVLWVQPVADDFHARFSACSRSYSYYLMNHPVRPALGAGRVGWFHAPLDVPAMQAAAGLLLGQHDFSSFRAAECQAKTPVKTLARFDISEHDGLIRFDLQADAFLHHMVRNLVGALVYVGKGAHAPEWMAGLLAARDRTQAPPTFMPDGLYLTAVGYPSHFGLPAACRRVFL